MREMISFGAGVNSIAMTILLVEEGWHGPIVFADPGGEHPETYCYMDHFEKEWLRPKGLGITRLSPSTHPDLYTKRMRKVKTLEAYCHKQGIIPLLAVRWCSGEFKRTPLVNWQQEHKIDLALIGMTSDEPRRVRDDPAVRYPLVERDITRPECHRIITRAGLDTPRKSGCFFCPGQRLSQWRDLCLNYPELYERGIALEKRASEHNQKHATLDSNGQSLEEMRDRRWRGQSQMDLSAWMPCACRL